MTDQVVTFSSDEIKKSGKLAEKMTQSDSLLVLIAKLLKTINDFDILKDDSYSDIDPKMNRENR